MSLNFDRKWYDSLKKSSLTPPAPVFGIVWSILYTLIAISGIIFFIKNKFNEPIGLTLFILQLFFNIIWSTVFFTQKNITGALVIIVILWFLILATIIQFYQTTPIAAILLVPYFLWVSLATYFTAYIYVNN